MRHPRFTHPQDGTISPVVSETYYRLAVSLHYARIMGDDLKDAALTPEDRGHRQAILVRKSAADGQAAMWSNLLKLAHEATHQEVDTTWTALTRALPEWAAGDYNAEYATPDGEYVLYKDIMYTNRNRPESIWIVTRWNDENDEQVAVVRGVKQARAVVAAHIAPVAGPTY